MQEQSPHERTGTDVMNWTTVVFLVVFVLLLPFCALSTGYEEGPAVMGRIITEAQQTGILWVNGGAVLLVTTILLFPLSLLSLVLFGKALVGYQQKKRPEKKTPVVWAGILCGVTIFLLGSSLYLFGFACVDDGSFNGNGSCGLPVRPGVVVPTPVPSTP
jgi:cytochrome bd-type quinol oxidase subunit 2